jgi:cytochrome P450
MTLYPKIQTKAQAEIDAVVGLSRLPNIDDLERLPYVEALVKEVFRYHPVLPLGLAHAPCVDDIHEGYLIPKGTPVFPNIW